MPKIILAGIISVVAMGMVAFAAVTAPIYQQSYVVEATITPLDADNGPPITVSEVWSTLVYRDATRFHTVVRVFGEALHFNFGGEDHFLLKRGSNNSSAGAYDPLKECLGLKYLADYETAPDLMDECVLSVRTPMVVKADRDGRIERLSHSKSPASYADFSIEFLVRPTVADPSYELTDQFRWIDDLKPYEDSVLPTNIPEEGNFVPASHYQKDFVVAK
jgi:hypothetical protein